MKISIVIISYNQGKFLEETIRSVVEQTYQEKEIILIDGGSTDNSINFIKKYAHHFAYWVSEKDNGQSDAIIKGFAKTTGEIITWINSDDVLMPNVLGIVAQTAVKKKNTDAVFFGGQLTIDEFGEIQDKFPSQPMSHFVARSLLPSLPQPGTFFGRKAYFHVGGIDSSFQYGMDKDLFCKLFFADIPYYDTGKYHAMFRQHSLQKGHSEFYRKLCDEEALLIEQKYGMDKVNSIYKRFARLYQIAYRFCTFYYFKVMYYRLFVKKRLRDFTSVVEIS